MKKASGRKAGPFFARALTDLNRANSAAIAAAFADQPTVDDDGNAAVGVDIESVIDALNDRTLAMLAPGTGTSALESALASSAIMLGNLITFWVTQATIPAAIGQMETFGRLALKAQEQQRKTLATLAEIRNPKRVAFVKQLNQAVNQQVNNSPDGGKTGKIPNFTTPELLEVIPGEQLDTRAQSPASGLDSRLEAVGAVHGTEDAGGQGGFQDERLEARRAVAGGGGMEPRADPPAPAVEGAGGKALTGGIRETT